MKYLGFLLICVYLSFVGVKLHAQTEYTGIPPSPNVKQFLEASSNSSLQTGELSISIPLLNLQGKGIEVPISVYFSAGGITYQSEESELGLGWSLVAGGVITQTIRGYKDPSGVPASITPWRHNANYLYDKWFQQENNPNPNNWVDIALETLTGWDPEPDLFRYSFLGHSGDIYFETSATGSLEGTLYPDKSFKILKTTAGYKIIGNDGTEYIFETSENEANAVTSWFLTEIRTVQGGIVTLQYTDVSKGFYDGEHMYSYISKQLSRIDYDYGYVTFSGNIESYNLAGKLIKGYEFGKGWGNPTDPTSTSREMLSKITQYGADGAKLPPYEFQYDYNFRLDKYAGSDGWNIPANTWAFNPFHLMSVSRNFGGQLSPWVQWVCSPDGIYCVPNVHGITVTSQTGASSMRHNFLSLTEMRLPSGGSESYYYERHDYGFFGTTQDTIDPGEYNQQHDQILGKRLRRKEIKDGNGHTQIIDYKYCLHNENYEQITDGYFQGPRHISSGVLINPTIYNSTMYKASRDNSGKLSGGLAAVPYNTMYPQNSMLGQSVYYSEVEEIFRSAEGGTNGKKIHYFDIMYALPSGNLVYLNYDISGPANILVGIPNTLYGKQTFPPDPEISAMSDQNNMYLAYPVGRFWVPELLKGKLLKEVTLNAGGDIVRLIENEFTAGYGTEKTLYGWIVKKIDDSDYSGPYPPTSQCYRYLIAQTQTTFGLKQLAKKTVTDYFQAGPVTEEQSFSYTNENLVRSITTTLSGGGSTVKEYVYPSDILFQTQSNLSAHALAIKKMKEKNITGIPIQTTIKKGTEYIAGTYTAFKQLPGGAVVADSAFYLGDQAGISVAKPAVNSSGKVERNGNFLIETTYLSYDQSANLTTTEKKGMRPETVIWGYGGQYPIAKIQNYTYTQVQANNALLSQLDLLDDYKIITEANRGDLSLCNQAIRGSLPSDVMIATYTYDPLIGRTSETDTRGQTSYFEYDNFRRLSTVKNNNSDIIKQYCYNYTGQLQSCAAITLPGENPPGGGPQTIYVKVELSNFQTINGSDPGNIYSVELANVEYRFYSNAACTQPYTLTAPLTINTAVRQTFTNNGGSEFWGEFPSPVYAPVGTNRVVFESWEQSLYVETGYDPVLGTLYNLYTTEYIVLPGDGYEVAPQ